MIVTREQGQSMVVDQYQKHKFLLVLFCTGFGKTKAALDAVATNDSKENGLIVCHTEVSRDVTWPAEITKWQPDLIRWNTPSNVELVCYASLKNIKGRTFGWVICDEAHYLTLNNAEFFKDNEVKSLILLTATEPEDYEKNQLIKQLSRRNKIEIKLDTAISSGVLNNYQIHVWLVDLLPTEWAQYVQLCKNVHHALDTRNPGFINMRTGERMRFIYNLPTKLKAAAYLRDQIRATGKRFVMFCGSIDQANKLSPYTYHSETTDEHYKAFARGDIDEIASIKQIQEGANIHNLQSALTVQLNSRQLGMIQRLGRLMRLEEGMVAKMHILVANKTKDLDWANKALGGLDHTKIKWHNLSRELFEEVII